MAKDRSIYVVADIHGSELYPHRCAEATYQELDADPERRDRVFTRRPHRARLRGDPARVIGGTRP